MKMSKKPKLSLKSAKEHQYTQGFPNSDKEHGGIRNFAGGVTGQWEPEEE